MTLFARFCRVRSSPTRTAIKSTYLPIARRRVAKSASPKDFKTAVPNIKNLQGLRQVERAPAGIESLAARRLRRDAFRTTKDLEIQTPRNCDERYAARFGDANSERRWRRYGNEN